MMQSSDLWRLGSWEYHHDCDGSVIHRDTDDIETGEFRR